MFVYIQECLVLLIFFFGQDFFYIYFILIYVISLNTYGTSVIHLVYNMLRWVEYSKFVLQVRVALLQRKSSHSRSDSSKSKKPTRDQGN